MTSYFDSSALVAVYVTEAHSARARREVRAAGQIPFTALHGLEVRNALRLLCGRGLVSAEDVRHLLDQIEEDREAQRLADVRMDLAEVFERAISLSATHTSRLLCRSLDVLHVAAALTLGSSRLVSGDDRQLALARTVGMAPVDIKTRRAARTRSGRRLGA